MDMTQLAAIITAILSAPVLKEVALGYFKLGSQRKGDDVAVREQLALRVETLETANQLERERHDATREKLFDLTVKYEVLLLRFEHLEKTLEIYRQSPTGEPGASAEPR